MKNIGKIIFGVVIGLGVLTYCTFLFLLQTSIPLPFSRYKVNNDIEKTIVQGQTYYMSPYFRLNYTVKDDDSHLTIYDATYLRKKTEKSKAEYWKFNKIPQEKMIAEIEFKGAKKKDDGYNLMSAIWVSKNMKKGHENLEFLNPKYLEHRVYPKSGNFHESSLKKMDEKNQAKLIAALKKVTAQKPKYGILDSDLGRVKSTDEIYLYNEKDCSVSMQASVVTIYDGTSYLSFSGDAYAEQWKLDKETLKLLKN
ncbi:MAG: hypothetical protein ACI31W_01895 [Lactococcus sp.]